MEFCVMMGCPEFTEPHSVYCAKHRDEMKAKGKARGKVGLISVKQSRRVGLMLNKAEYVCRECGNQTWMYVKETYRRTKPRCPSCGSVSLVIKTHVAKKQLKEAAQADALHHETAGHRAQSKPANKKAYKRRKIRGRSQK